MSAQPTCSREVLTQSCVAHIERCSCGALHIVLGPFTLRLSADQYRTLLATLQHAQGQLDAADGDGSGPHALATLLGRHAPTGQG